MWKLKENRLKLDFCALSQLPCKVMAVLLHFFFLSAFAWMLVEGLHLYSMVVKVFGSEMSKHFYYYGIGWGRCAAQKDTSVTRIMYSLCDFACVSFSCFL